MVGVAHGGADIVFVKVMLRMLEKDMDMYVIFVSYYIWYNAKTI